MVPDKTAGQKTILVADDDATVTLTLATYLRNQGYAVLTAADGEAAMSLIEKEKPDLAILDIDMPKGSGIVLTRQVRAHRDRRLKRLPILMLTAKTDKRHEAYSSEAGANAFIPKPIALGDLAQKIKEYLRA
jgi:DNA-binding response OmpR family regulator